MRVESRSFGKSVRQNLAAISRAVSPRSVALFGFSLILWLAIAWLSVDRAIAIQADSYLRRERSYADRDSRAVDAGISQAAAISEGIMANLAHQDWILAILHEDEEAGGPKSRKSFVEDPLSGAISRSLFALVTDVKTITILAVFNTRGDCVASSNAATPTSWVGNNFADRRYVQTALQGQAGVQFVTGRVTSQPGMIIAEPVIRGGSVIGMIVGKFDQSSFEPWLGFADSFVADDNGVILFARDSTIRYKSLPGGKIEDMDQPERLNLYKRADFNAVPLARWQGSVTPEVVRYEDRPIPVLFSTVALSVGTGYVGVIHPLPRLLMIERDRWRLFVLALLLGTVIGFVLFVLAVRLRDMAERRRMAESEIAFNQSMMDAAASAIAVYAEDGRCLAANDAMARILGTGREEIGRHSFRLNDIWLTSGLSLAAETVLGKGVSQRGHWRLTSGQGREIWVEASMKRFTHDAENFLLVMFADVTDQHWRGPADRAN